MKIIYNCAPSEGACAIYCLIKSDPSVLRVEQGRGGVLTEEENTRHNE